MFIEYSDINYLSIASNIVFSSHYPLKISVRYPWPTGLELSGRKSPSHSWPSRAGLRVPQSPGPRGNVSWLARCRRSSSEGKDVHGLRVLGIALVGTAQMVESPQAVSSLPSMAPRFLRAMGFLGSVARARQWCSLCPAAGRPLAGSRAPGQSRRPSGRVRAGGSGAVALAPDRAGRGHRFLRLCGRELPLHQPGG